MVFIYFTTQSAYSEVRSHFTTQELLDDYDQMWAILYESYPFFLLTGKNENEIESLRLEKRTQIETRITSVSGLYLVMQDTFKALGNIAHLRALGPEEYCPIYFSKMADLNEGTIWSDTYIYLDPQTIESYTLLGFNKTHNSTSLDVSSVNIDYFPDIHTICFHLPTFYSDILCDQGIPITDYLNVHPDVENIIFDITHNRGGYTYIWIYHIVSAFTDPVEWMSTSYIRITEPIAGAYEGINTVLIDRNAKKLPDWINTMRLTHKSYHWLTLPLESNEVKKVDKPIKRWLVIDEEVASAADMFARFCKDTGWATVVGRTTKGGGLVSAFSPSVIRLNNTGILFWFFAESGINEDGTPNVLRGTTPDYFAKPNETPLDACIRLIKKFFLANE